MRTDESKRKSREKNKTSGGSRATGNEQLEPNSMSFDGDGNFVVQNANEDRQVKILAEPKELRFIFITFTS